METLHLYLRPHPRTDANKVFQIADNLRWVSCDDVTIDIDQDIEPSTSKDDSKKTNVKIFDSTAS